MIGLGAAYVLVSSWFGLTGPSLSEGELSGAVSFFVDVWTDSLLADAAFVSGTLAAGALATWLAIQAGPLPSVVAGFGANWLVYLVSYLLLDDVTNPAVSGVLEAAGFVLEFGTLGLVLAAVIPAVAVAVLRRRWPDRLSGPRPIIQMDP